MVTPIRVPKGKVPGVFIEAEVGSSRGRSGAVTVQRCEPIVAGLCARCVEGESKSRETLGGKLKRSDALSVERLGGGVCMRLLLRERSRSRIARTSREVNYGFAFRFRSTTPRQIPDLAILGHVEMSIERCVRLLLRREYPGLERHACKVHKFIHSSIRPSIYPSIRSFLVLQ